MEYEIQLNTTFNTTEDYVYEEEPFAWYELILPLTALLGCVVSVLIVGIICRHKLLHSKPYYCIASFCICYAFYLLLCPMVFELVPRIYRHVPTELVCVGTNSVFTAWFGTLAFLLLLLLEWYVPVHCSRPCSSKCARFSMFISLSVGGFTMTLLAVSVITCVHGFYFPISVLLAVLAYFVVFFAILVLTVVHCIKVKTMDIVAVDSNVLLYIVVAYFLCWIGHYIMIVLYFFNKHILFHPATFIFVNCVSFLCPGIMFWILYKYDDRFRKCVLKYTRKNNLHDHSDRVEVKSDQNQFENLI